VLVIALAAGMLLMTGPAFAADPQSDVDTLWNQPEGVSVDSGWYFIQAGWDQAALALQRDPAQHSLAQLTQANSDLLNAYSLLAEARTDPGARPVPVLDPALASLYATVTGVKVRAPLGSVFAWLNQGMLTVEGRGTTLDIAANLLHDFGQRQQAADSGLPRDTGLDDIWVANSQRQQVMLAKLQALVAESPDTTSLTAVVQDLDHQRQALLEHHHGKRNGADSNGNGQGHKDKKP
jgi:hypothetical protein